MEREYVRGNRRYWKEVRKYVYGLESEPNSEPGICGDDKAIFVKNKVGEFTLYTDEVVCEAIISTPHWHEVRPWETPYNPKPFDKVLGWDNNPSDARPDIFLYKRLMYGDIVYACTTCTWEHIKPYDEEEYTERIL